MSRSSDTSSSSTDFPPPRETVQVSIDTSFLVNDKWKIESLIGSGTAATVYSATDVDSSEIVAVKIEHRDEGLLRNERNIYQHLGCFSESCRAFGLPYIHFYGEHGPNHLALVMDCLGPSLDLPSGQMDQEEFSRIAVKALDIFQYVHNRGVIHWDTWAGNFLRGRSDADGLYLVDFGVAANIGRSRTFETLCIRDLEDLGRVLFQLRAGEPYLGEKVSSGVVPELDRYFQMLDLDHLRDSLDYTSLREMFEGFLIEHRRSRTRRSSPMS